MAKMNDLIEALAAAIARDTAVQVWANLEYDRPLMVMENCDPRNDPGEEDCPMVILYPMQKSGGLSQGVKAHVIGVSCVVYDAEQPESIEGVIRFNGGRMVEELREKVSGIIKDNLPSDIHLEAVFTEYDTIGQFPYVSAGMEITLTQEKLIGADPYE